MRPKPSVGDTLYSLNVGNASRHCEPVLTPVTVLKVGRSYFTCAPVGSTFPYQQGQYHLDDWREKTEYSANSRLYASQQEREEELEAIKHADLIKKTFDAWTGRKLPLIALRQIAAIIESNPPAP